MANGDNVVKITSNTIKLNLGCGSDIKAGFFNIDIRTLTGVDFVADITNIDDLVQNGTVEEINAYDVLEHFPCVLVPRILRNWVVKLKPRGKIIIRVPDLGKILTCFKNGELTIFESQRLVFGGQLHEFDYHKAGFTQGMLEGLLIGAGCSEIIQVVRDPGDHNVTLVALR